ncbi:MAG TPA: hypothetical protein VIY69_07195, partial [Candidatus Acidoferrales bacterium]
FFFAGTETKMLTQSQDSCSALNGRCVNEARKTFRELAGFPCRVKLAKALTDDETQNPVAEKFEALIIRAA